MLEARKENKVYKIDEAQKKRYLNDGFDIYKDGVLSEHSPKKMITYSEHLKALDALKSEMGTGASNVTDLLKSYAEKKGVELGSATSAKGILDKILETEKE